MAEQDIQLEDVLPLLAAICDGSILDEDFRRIQRWMTSSSDVRRWYLAYMNLHCELQRQCGDGANAMGGEFTQSEAGSPRCPQQDSGADKRPHRLGRETTSSHFAIPTIYVRDASSGGPAGIPWLSGFLQVGPLSYFVSIVVMVVAIVVASQYHAPDDGLMSNNVPVHRNHNMSHRSRPIAVGRVSAMADCEWMNASGDIDVAAIEAVASPVRLGQHFELRSGLLELAFDSGAKVILEGPCVFRVDADGGFLQAGRLTGLCESAARDANADMASNANPPFSIRTPTATVTDLGTEFGVEVDQAGRTTSHVYRGLVEMQQTGSQDSKTKLVLREGEAASVAHDRDGNPRMARIEGVPATFVRRLPQSRIRIPVFGTGLASVGVRGEDAHWQWVARSDDPGFEPRNATIVMSARPEWTPRRSQHAEMAGPSERWISTGFVWASTVPPGAVCTFRTTFLLDESLAKHAHLQGIVRADKCVRAIRLNGHDVPSKATDGKYSWEGWMAPGGTAFAVDQGFCGGNNAIEIDVEADGSKQSEVDELRAAGADARSAVGLCATMEGWGQLPQPSETQNQR